ncbi:hypothetical protein C8Q76DRAFT_615356 [Earliella scabrosa]|nr:hypothetical protein C8Q76DRAFT_615356 [Earliella scabrosa]
MAPRRKCPVCGSKQWHKEPQSGLIACSEGHVLQNYRNETREVHELGPHAVRKRTLKSSRKKQEKHSKADPKLYHGARARYHYFQCLQLILRMQVAALTRLWQLPPEFEACASICRDTWALNLSLLPNPPDAEPLTHMHGGGDTDAGPPGPSIPDTTQSKPKVDKEENEQITSDDEKGKETNASASSSSSESDDSDDGDSELDKLMRENSESPSSDDDEHRGPQKDRTSVPVKKRRRNFGQYDVPATTISVLVIACWTLRLPVTYMDFVRLVESYDLPYLDTVRLLPEDMVRHLRKQTVQALSPHNAPSARHLHFLSSRLARLLYSTYGVYTPEMNAAPILWRAVRDIQGSPIVYAMTKKLARVVSIPLTLHRTLAPELVRTKKKDPLFHKQDSAIPEVALLAAVIVVLKMVYGLDGQPRRPRDKSDPACALPTLAELLRAIRDVDASDLKRTPAYSLDTELSVLDMDEKMLDEYLLFCEKALLPREDRMPPRNATTDHFPLHRESGSDSPAMQHDASDKPVDPDWSTKPANTFDEESDTLKSGERYTIYNTQDILGSLPEDLDLVISRAARWAGVDEGYISGVVERFERRVVRWWDTARRKDRGKRVSGSE